MPNSETFLYSYLFGATPPDGTSVYPAPLGPFSFDVTDTGDGTVDGETAVTDIVRISTAPGDDYTLVGFTSNGDPVLSSPGNFFVASNDPNLTGNIGFTTAGGPYVYCFAQGTGIDTPTGERPIETLQDGDVILSASGRAIRVRWLGRQTLSRRFARERAQMVCIPTGALGNHADLLVTGDHGMVLDGYVVNASALVGLSGIDWVPLSETPEQFTVYHVETENHDVILANGAPSETFIDYAGRARFDNYAEFLDLYGDENQIAESPLPRISAARHLPAHLRASLVA
jgi:hypothetical protein